MRRLVLLVILLLPVAAAQSPFLGARADVEAELHLDRMETDTQVRAGTAGVGGCGDPEWTLLPDGFRFAESAEETGCLEALLSVDVPAGAESVTVSFAADRQASNTFQFSPIDFVQSFRFKRDNGTVLTEVPVYEPSEPAHPTPRNASASLRLEPGTEQLVLSWLFDDRAQLENQVVANPTRGQAFQVTTDRLAVRFGDLPVRSDWSEVERSVRDGREDAVYELGLDVPAELFLGGHPHVAAVLADRMEVTRIDGPGGPIDPQELHVEGSETTTYVLPAEVLEAHGPGRYVVVLGQVRTVAPQGSLLSAAVVVLALPLVAGTYGGLQERRLHRVVGTTGLHSALVTYRYALATVAAIYAALLILVFLTGQVWALVVPPLGLIAVAYIAAFVAVALLFVVVATYGFQRQVALSRNEVEALERVRRELERSNKDLEHFAYIASHDLQEPLRTISGFSQLLERRYGDKLDDQGRRYIQKTVDGSQRMQTLIGDLLAYSRVSTGGQRPQPIDAGALVDEEVADLKAILKETRGKVERSALPTLPADRSQLRQVFSNLILNALKYRHPDRPPRVHVDAVLEGRLWHFRVQDNGKGIPEEQHERIFVIFQRLEQKYDGDGTGLGLAIVQKIVERHGGRVWVESQVGQGSTFHFTLPASKGDQP